MVSCFHSFSICIVVLFLCCNCQAGKDNASEQTGKPQSAFFSKNRRVDLDIPGLAGYWLKWQPDERLKILISTRNGLLTALSLNNGKSWSPPILTEDLLSGEFPVFKGSLIVGKIRSVKDASGGQMYYISREKDGWSKPFEIRDTCWGDFGIYNPVVDSHNNIYYAWIDWREGNPDIYFSTSFDSGKTWTPNIRINDDRGGQWQEFPRLFVGSRGNLYITWDDMRDANTLYDIYFSSSRDSGKTWSVNKKINDDTTHTWQLAPFPLMNSKEQLAVAWMDYRDKEIGGDITSNIYFSSSTYKGKSWNKNTKITNAKYGNNYYPFLSSGNNDTLFCVWKSTEYNLNGDILFSYSPDFGQTWAFPKMVNDNENKVRHEHHTIIQNKNGKTLIAWWDWRETKPGIYLSSLRWEPDFMPTLGKTIQSSLKKKKDVVLSAKEGEILFQDNFANGASPLWDEIGPGEWVVRDSMYISYGGSEQISLVGNADWRDYTIRGKFSLDLIQHHIASIYFRAKTRDNQLTYYRLNNFFRNGVFLDYSNGDQIIPITTTSYFFQKTTWYDFKVVVKESVLNYFVNDSLLISFDGLRKNSHGKAGIGGGYFPVYFKEICIHELE